MTFPSPAALTWVRVTDRAGSVPVVAVWLDSPLPPAFGGGAGETHVTAALIAGEPGVIARVRVHLSELSGSTASFTLPVGIALLLAGRDLADGTTPVPVALYLGPAPDFWWSLPAPPDPVLIMEVPALVLADALALAAPAGYLTTGPSAAWA